MNLIEFFKRLFKDRKVISMRYEFSIKKTILNSEEVIFTPVVRTKHKFFGRDINGNWERITKVYNQYILIDIDFNPMLTEKQCNEHIAGYEQQLKQYSLHQIKDTNFQNIKQTEI